jgi:hypothetical protein
MFDAAEILEVFLESLKLPCVPAQENRFDAVVMVEVEMLRAHDPGRGFMLEVQDLVDKVALVVVVDEPDHAQDFLLPFQFLMRGLMPDHGPQSVRPAGIMPLTDLVIDELEHIRLNGDAEPAQRT